MELFSIDSGNLYNEKYAANALEKYAQNENNVPNFENS